MANKSIAMMVGASAHSQTEREKTDYYATDPVAIEKLLGAYVKRDKETLDPLIWEPACGEGHLAKALKEEGYRVLSTDLVDRGYGDKLDFLASKGEWCGDILTNPPFKVAEKFVRHGYERLKKGKRLLIFQRIHFLESSGRHKLFKELPPKFVYIHSSRVGTAMNGDFERFNAKAMAYAWYVWEKGYKGETTVRWIP